MSIGPRTAAIARGDRIRTASIVAFGDGVPGIALATVALALVATSAPAADRAFWSEMPTTYMTEQDRKIAIERINAALDEGKDGETYRWENPKTGASGSVMPKSSFTRDGLRCRSADVSTMAGGRRNASTWKLCKVNEGWKIVDD